MSRAEAINWQRLAAPIRHARAIIKEHASRGDLGFWFLRGFFRYIPLNKKMRDEMREFYIRHLATGQRARKDPMQGVPAHGWGSLVEGRWTRERFDAEKSELEALSLVLRKEKW